MENIDQFLKNMKILFVEDDEETRNQYKRILGKIFTNLTLENNGLEAFLKFHEKKMKNENYDIIISDIDMPKMNGIELIKKVRDLDSEIPIIFITAKTSSNILYNSIQLGISSYIPKPIDMDKLIKEIKKCSEKRYYKDKLVQKNFDLENKLLEIEKIKQKYQNDINSLRYQVVNLTNKLSSINSSPKELNNNEEIRMDILKKKNEEIQKMIRVNKLLKVENDSILIEKRKLEDIVGRKDELIESYRESIRRLQYRQTNP